MPSGIYTRTAKPPCTFPGCGLKFRAKGLCNGHWLQQSRGEVLRPLFENKRRRGTPPRITCDEAPCPRVDLEGPCHIFRGYKDPNGYGMVLYEDKLIGVHVYIWLKTQGSIAEGFEIDHRCRVRACCNEDHLREVTHQVNCTENVVGAGWQLNLAKTHCPQGHPYDEKNTRVYKGRRNCRECARIKDAIRAVVRNRQRVAARYAKASAVEGKP